MERNRDPLARRANRLAWLESNQFRLALDIRDSFQDQILDMALDIIRSDLHQIRADVYDDLFDSRPCTHRPRAGEKRRHGRPRHSDPSKLCKVNRPLTGSSVAFLQNRELGLSPHLPASQKAAEFKSTELPDFVSQHLPPLLTEKEFDLDTVNKIFAAKWLNENQVVMGTKCNKLMVLDVRTDNLIHIQSLKSSANSIPADCPCGIHSIAINPSRTMLATGGQNTNDLAVYELPTFDPMCVGEGAHKDWIFDMDWVDDQHIITGSRDSSVALWRITDRPADRYKGRAFPVCQHAVVKPRSTQMCHQAVRVRALAVSQDKGLLGVLSMNAKFHFWDIETFRQVDSVELPWKRENVCVASSDSLSLFAVGSQAYVTTIDHRVPGKNSWLQIPPRHGERGIRSLSFNHNIITIGTGDGRLMFYDMRQRKFLFNQDGKHCELTVGDGWLCEDSTYHEHFHHGTYPNAIYTHSYDESKGRLFAAGGPLPAGLHGNYAGIFY